MKKINLLFVLFFVSAAAVYCDTEFAHTQYTWDNDNQDPKPWMHVDLTLSATTNPANTNVYPGSISLTLQAVRTGTSHQSFQATVFHNGVSIYVSPLHNDDFTEDLQVNLDNGANTFQIKLHQNTDSVTVLSPVITIYSDQEAPTTPAITNLTGGYVDSSADVSWSGSSDLPTDGHSAGLNGYVATVTNGPNVSLDSGVLSTRTRSYTFNLPSSTFKNGNVLTFSVRAVDQFDNTSSASSRTATLDTVAPSTTITRIPPVFTNWFNSSTAAGGVWNTVGTDSLSQINSSASGYIVRYSLTDPGTVTSTSFDSLTALSGGTGAVTTTGIAIPSSAADGYYYIKLFAADNVGNTATAKVDGPFKYDNTPPSFAGASTVSITGSGQIAMGLPTASDAKSGLTATPYTVKYAFAASDLTGTGGLTWYGPGNLTSITQAVDPTFYGKTVYFKASAVDNAGNRTSLAVTGIAIPQKISLGTAIDAAATTDTDMAIAVSFGLTPAELKTYNSLVLKRSNTGSTISLSDLNLNPASITVDANGQFQESGNWHVDGFGKIYYRDVVAASSGAGHKIWKYALTAQPAIAAISSSSNVVFPNHQGTAGFTIMDTNGVDVSDSEHFKVYEDGAVQITFQGTDVDRDDWQVEVDAATSFKQVVDGKTYTFASYKPLSGTSPVAYGYATGYGQKTLPLRLTMGPNNILLSWTEGAGQEEPVYRSAIKTVTLQWQPSKGYFLTVVDGDLNSIASDDHGLLARPGQPLVFNVTSTDGDASLLQWDFGDGTSDTGGNQTHVYHQVSGQTTDSAQYTIALKIPDPDTGQIVVPIPITVRDTQEGALYESETWHGDHTVIGLVVVPTDLTLTIATGTSVSFRGGLGSGFSQGITILGSLTAGDGTSFAKVAGQTRGWGTIFVQGNAVIGTALISDAGRGLTFAQNSSGSLTGTKLIGNATGIQVLGVSSVAIDASQIKLNTVYGIKEERGARPVVKDSILTGNFRNYYSWDKALLTIGAINALAGNSGNQGE